MLVLEIFALFIKLQLEYVGEGSMKRKFILAVVVILLVGVFSLAFEIRDVKAATRNFSLYGYFNQGWGFTPLV